MSKTKLNDLYREHQGKVSDKWSSSLSVYEELLKAYQNNEINLLEIGIQNGGSLEIWAKYFPKCKSLIGCDIDEKCKNLIFDSQAIKVIVGDANSKATKTEILKCASSFDIVIDDGSHRSSDIIASFVNYFPKIKDNGIYIAEDLHCSYWQEFEGGLYDPYSSMAFFKKIADILNQEHWANNKTRSELISGILSKYNIKIEEKDLSEIHSIEFLNSMCIVKKRAYKNNELGQRVFSGKDESVVVRTQEARALPYVPPRQDMNPWSNRLISPEEDIVRLEKLNMMLTNNEKILEDKLKYVLLENINIKNSISWKITKPLRYIRSKIKK